MSQLFELVKNNIVYHIYQHKHSSVKYGVNTIVCGHLVVALTKVPQTGAFDNVVNRLISGELVPIIRNDELITDWLTINYKAACELVNNPIQHAILDAYEAHITTQWQKCKDRLKVLKDNEHGLDLTF